MCMGLTVAGACAKCWPCYWSQTYTLSTELENCVNRALNINLDISKEMACINRNLHCFSDNKFVQIHKQSNFFGLLPSEYVSQHMDLEDEHQTVFCSQRSEI